MKCQITLELNIHEQIRKSELLMHLMPAIQKLGEILCPTTVELTHIIFPNDKSSPHQILEVGKIRVDIRLRTVSVDGTRIPMTPTEYKLLCALMNKKGEVQDRKQLLHEVWGMHPDSNTRTVDVHIKRLRDKLGSSNNVIQTVSGIGYVIN